MPIDKKDYPENWEWLSRQIKTTAGNRCELCYAPNGAIVYRDKNDIHPWRIADVERECTNELYAKIVLTVHHIDSDKKNNTKQNLLCCCQRCHLRLDLQKHMRTRAEKKGNLLL